MNPRIKRYLRLKAKEKKAATTEAVAPTQPTPAPAPKTQPAPGPAPKSSPIKKKNDDSN